MMTTGVVGLVEQFVPNVGDGKDRDQICQQPGHRSKSTGCDKPTVDQNERNCKKPNAGQLGRERKAADPKNQEHVQRGV